jgi:hypothetical protein
VAYDLNLVGQTASATRAPGELGVLIAEVPASLVGAASGVFAAANVNPPYAQAAVLEVLTAPERFTGTFSFLGRTDPTGGRFSWSGTETWCCALISRQKGARRSSLPMSYTKLNERLS